MERQNNPWMKESVEVTKACNESKSSAELQEKLAQILAKQGINTRENRGLYDATPDSDVRTQQASSSLPAVSGDPASTRCSRILYVINNRFEIFSDSEAGLDSQETALRAMYGQQ